MPQRSSWLAVQALINQRLTNLAILTDLLSARQTPQISLLAGLGRFFSLSRFVFQRVASLFGVGPTPALIGVIFLPVILAVAFLFANHAALTLVLIDKLILRRKNL